MARDKTIIVGGGASGMMAAIMAARNGAKTTLLEQKEKLGKKVMATGNGRCNLSNRQMDPSFFHSGGPLLFQSVYRQFDLEETIGFFQGLGAVVVELGEGKLYPRSLQATSIVELLTRELDRLKVVRVLEETVERVEAGERFKVFGTGGTYYGNKLVLATGGLSHPNLGSTGTGYRLAKELGHSLVEPFPAIVQLRTDYPHLKRLSGTKTDCLVWTEDGAGKVLRKEFGEVLFTDYGISGPPVLQLGRIVAERQRRGLSTPVRLDLCPEYGPEALDSLLADRFSRLGYKTCGESLVGMLHQKLILPLLKSAGLDPEGKACNVDKTARERLGQVLKGLSMEAVGTMDFNHSQVTAGGVSSREVDRETLESLLVPGLHFCGEILDLDGDCGGYNLQWAWSSGAVVGRRMY
ncbi:NAD(P)/FAD-dependent oxidoreductase [Anaerotalea alkaliphila]|uniref:NAD(P)/FAD-dependent oxidoreductase n=1 Tax=Anaerotalea alkaliphila TaxID=2662126 RepID=A0A7X5HWZ8_9FIRM|nr:NAD(P)/FAD-dependent oxidoreductase [Anaerotalea alkaliphila]NDL68152.1 NAD(P)/FAD-dependent oxidoreductase [Anaerotalea alkaliphila]